MIFSFSNLFTNIIMNEMNFNEIDSKDWNYLFADAVMSVERLKTYCFSFA